MKSHILPGIRCRKDSRQPGFGEKPVSSILRALKKLEKETPQSQDEFILKKRISEKSTTGKQIKIVFSAFFLIVVLAVIFFLYKGFPLAPQKPSASEVKPIVQTPADSFSRKTTPAGTPARNEDAVSPLPAKKQVHPDDPSFRAEIKNPGAKKSQAIPVPDPGVPGTSGEAGNREPSPSQESTLRLDTPPPPLPENGIPPRPFPGKTRNQEEQIPQPGKPADSPEDNPKISREKIIENAFRSLAVQAIVYSDIPNERMAVINGKMLKKGYTINGFRVKEILADYVIMERHGYQKKLKPTP